VCGGIDPRAVKTTVLEVVSGQPHASVPLPPVKDVLSFGRIG